MIKTESSAFVKELFTCLLRRSLILPSCGHSLTLQQQFREQREKMGSLLNYRGALTFEVESAIIVMKIVIKTTTTALWAVYLEHSGKGRECVVHFCRWSPDSPGSAHHTLVSALHTCHSSGRAGCNILSWTEFLCQTVKRLTQCKITKQSTIFVQHFWKSTLNPNKGDPHPLGGGCL